jgi:hypothetical protein
MQAISPSEGYLAMMEDIFGCHNWEVKVAWGIKACTGQRCCLEAKNNPNLL